MKPFQRMLGSVHLYAGESRVGGQPGVGWEARVGGFTPLCSWGQWTQRNTLLRVWASIWACQTAPGPRACPRGRRCLWFRGGRTVSSRVKAKVPMWLRSLNYPRCLLSLAVSHIQRASFSLPVSWCFDLGFVNLFFCYWLLCFHTSFENLCSTCFSVDPLHFPSPHVVFPPISSSLPSHPLLSILSGQVYTKLQIQTFAPEFPFTLWMLGFLVSWHQLVHSKTYQFLTQRSQGSSGVFLFLTDETTAKPVKK